MKHYLENLIKVVNDDDWKKLRSLNIRSSKTKDYLNLLLDRRNGELPSKKEICARFSINDQLLRKMKSVLLRKCYQALAPEGGLELLEVLCRYKLDTKFNRELRKQERSIKADRLSEKQRAEFYYKAFEYYRNLPFSKIDIKILEVFASHYLKTVSPGKVKEEKIIMRLKVLHIIIIKSFYGSVNPSHWEVIKNELDGYTKNNSAKPSPKLNAMLNFIWGNYHYYTTTDKSLSLSFFMKVRDIIKTHPNALSYYEICLTECFIGTVLYETGHLKKAISYFEKVLTDYPLFATTDWRVINRLIELYMIDGNLEEAKELLDKHLLRFIDNEIEPDIAAQACLSYTKYYLLTGELEMAFIYLTKARNFLNRKVFTRGDIDYKILEILYFIFRSELKFANSLITSGIHSFYSKSKEKNIISAIEKFKLLKKLCRSYATGAPSKETFEQSVHEVFRGYKWLLGLLVLKAFKLEIRLV